VIFKCPSKAVGLGGKSDRASASVVISASESSFCTHNNIVLPDLWIQHFLPSLVSFYLPWFFLSTTNKPFVCFFPHKCKNFTVLKLGDDARQKCRYCSSCAAALLLSGCGKHGCCDQEDACSSTGGEEGFLHLGFEESGGGLTMILLPQVLCGDK
jgi:hypothetical protein